MSDAGPAVPFVLTASERALGCFVKPASRRSFRQRFVDSVWASHPRSIPIRKALIEVLGQLGSGRRGLNVGAGTTDLHPSLINLDITPGPAIHVRASSVNLPFPNGTFDVVLSQEVVEHVHDPFQTLREMRRVLRPGGTLYFQVPFIIGYHPGPTDYWRFTREGVVEVVKQAGFECGSVTMAVGPASGFHRIAVEFFATLAARAWAGLYIPTKAAFALLMYPIKWLDPLLSRSPEADRIAGGYFVICKR
jgi:SAM-dependent methyltransferase